MLGMLLISAQLLAQNRTVSGKVTDDKGNGVANASVLIKGTNAGTTTGADGNFSLSVPSTAKALLISYVGLGEKEITLTSSDTYNVSLSAVNRTDMSEIVVVAYGQAKRADLTGSVATVGGGDIENKPFTSLDKALQGQVAGLQSVAASGAPGANQQIRIRGISSINASNAPLWVIDGVPVNANDLSRLTTTANILATMNPNDIESVTVLKDAASASIYGSRAANGVILVTTKKGRAGKTKFRLDGEAGQSDIAYINDKYLPLNAQQYLDITREGLVNAGATQSQINNTLASLGLGNGTDYNWWDALFRRGKQQQYNLSASGGDAKTTFFISGGYFNQEGTTLASDLKRYTGSIRVTNKASDKLSIGANINGGFVGQHTPLAGGAFGNPSLSALFILPTRSAYKSDGTFNILTPDFPTSATFNTVALAEMDKRYLKESSLRGSVNAEYAILSNLKFRTQFGGDLDILEEDQYNNPLYGDGVALDPGPPASPTFNPGIRYNQATTGRAFSAYTRYFNWVWTNTLSLNQNLTRNGDLMLNLQAGYEAQESRSYFTTLQGRGFSLSPTLYLQYPSSAATPSQTTGAISDYSFASVFGSGDVNYKDRFIVSGSFRRDGSSRFGSNNPYGNFWSVGGSWNVDKEDFMQNVSVISQLKLRSSYGVNGNAGIGNYDYFPSYSFASSYNSTPGSAPSNVGNRDLTWELNKPLNVGIDIGFLKNRLTVSADWYKRTSDDLLLDVPLSPTSGFATKRQNIGTMENKGVEASIIGTPIQRRDFTWQVNFNFAYNKNRVTSMPSPIIGTFLVKPGYDVQTFYARQYYGVDPSNGDPLWYLDSSRTKTTNNYSTAQRVPYGTASPKYFGGLTNTFTYKGFTVEAQFNYQFGNYVQDQWASYYLGAGFNPGFNKVRRILDRWQKPGDLTGVPKYIYGGNKSFQSFSTFYLYKGDFVRLRNIQLGYDIPKSFLAKAKISSAFFYVRGTNLWTWVKDKDLSFDPEQGVASQTNLDVLIPKTMTIGVNLGF